VRRSLPEGEHRIVDAFPHVWECSELLSADGITTLHGGAERFHVTPLQRADEFGPGFESRLARDGQLRIGQLERTRRSAGVAADRAKASQRGGIAVTRGADQIFGELALLFEIGHGRPPSTIARVRIMG
jgi:hypothetical protein